MPRRKPRTGSETVQLKLRFTERLRARIAHAAGKSGRSMNAEIVHRIEQSFMRDEKSMLADGVIRSAMMDVIEVLSKAFPEVAERFGRSEAQRDAKEARSE
jgi:hypothetical protein